MKKYVFFILYAILIIVINLFIFRFAFVYGNSMNPTLKDKQLVFVNLLYSNPKHSDIIITTKENPFRSNLIKRVIATEGDTVLITESAIYINDILLQESYLAEPAHYEPLELTVPAGHVFIMGDNRNFSKDSRHIGCIPVSEILGKVL